jgi:ribosomal protein S18 acetylase RimI-like enzyme
MITLQTCKEDDMASLKKVYDKAYEDVEFAPQFLTKEHFVEMCLREDVFYDRSLVAVDDEDEGEVVGFLLAGLRNKYARISMLGVLPDHREKGIAKRLINRLIRDLREIEDVKSITVEVFEGSDHVVELFEDFGFESERILHTMYRECPERDVEPAKYQVSTEFPTELLRYYTSFHHVSQPWAREHRTLVHYQSKVVGYGIATPQSKVAGYTLVGFDSVILDFTISSVYKDITELPEILMEHLFSKFDNLIVVDIPEDDEQYELFVKKDFSDVYKKHELVIVFDSFD